MKNNTPLVTIVTPAFDCAAYIQDTYASILAQTEQAWEWFVVDDASQDATAQILAQIEANDSRVTITTLAENAGAGMARNMAIRSASGRFIAFLDADDLWHPEKLERQTTMMLNTGTGLSYAAYDIIDRDGQPKGHASVPLSTTYHALLKHNVIGCLTAMYDTQIYGRVEMPDARKRQDYGLWLRLLRAGGTAHAVPGTLATYRRLPNSLSSNKIGAAVGAWSVYRRMENMGLFKSSYYFLHYAIGTSLRRINQMTNVMGTTKSVAPKNRY